MTSLTSVMVMVSAHIVGGCLLSVTLPSKPHKTTPKLLKMAKKYNFGICTPILRNLLWKSSNKNLIPAILYLYLC